MAQHGMEPKGLKMVLEKRGVSTAGKKTLATHFNCMDEESMIKHLLIIVPCFLPKFNPELNPIE